MDKKKLMINKNYKQNYRNIKINNLFLSLKTLELSKVHIFILTYGFINLLFIYEFFLINQFPKFSRLKFKKSIN